MFHRSKSNAAGQSMFPLGFNKVFNQLISPELLAKCCSVRTTARGRPASLPRTTLLRALVFHFASGVGTFGQHLLSLTGRSMSESTLSERRSALPWEVFERLLRCSLKPLAQKKKHAGAFWRDWRLLAMDGTCWDLPNTPGQALPRTKASKGGWAAFAKLRTTVLLELGLHNPLAVALARHGQSEWALIGQILAQLPKGCLLLADKLYGCAAFAVQALDRCQKVGSHFLVRVSFQHDYPVLKRLSDGSRIIRVPYRDRKVPKKILRYLELREIRVRAQHKGFRPVTVRLWTTLTDEKEAPALELAQLYCSRWDEELYFLELKHHLRKGQRLQSQTLETALQEVAAIILASALLAQERARATGKQVPVLQISFAKTLELVRALWILVALAGELVSDELIRKLTQRIGRYLRKVRTPKRRSRSCQRKVRQIRKGYSRMVKPTSIETPIQVSIMHRRRS